MLTMIQPTPVLFCPPFNSLRPKPSGNAALKRRRKAELPRNSLIISKVFGSPEILFCWPGAGCIKPVYLKRWLSEK